MVLQGAGDDLRGRGRAAVDQHHDGQAVGQIAFLGVEALGVVGLAPSGRDDLAAIDEGVADQHGLFQQAAGIVAQVDHVADQLVAQLVLDLGHAALDAGHGLLVEGGDPDIADIALRAGRGPSGS